MGDLAWYPQLMDLAQRLDASQQTMGPLAAPTAAPAWPDHLTRTCWDLTTLYQAMQQCDPGPATDPSLQQGCVAALQAMDHLLRALNSGDAAQVRAARDTLHALAPTVRVPSVPVRVTPGPPAGLASGGPSPGDRQDPQSPRP